MKKHIFFAGFLVLMIYGCSNKQTVEVNSNNSFPGYTQIASKDLSTTYYVNLNSVKFGTDGNISFQFIAVFPDKTYTIQEGSINLQGNLEALEGIKYTADGKLIGKSNATTFDITADKQGLKDLRLKVQEKAQEAFAIKNVVQITDAKDFIKSAKIQALLKETLGKSAYISFMDCVSDYSGDLQCNGAQRLFSAFMPHYAIDRCFTYVDLLTGRCIAACLDNLDVSIYGASAETELPKIVSDYFVQLRDERSATSDDSEFNLHFLQSGEPIVKQVNEVNQGSDQDTATTATKPEATAVNEEKTSSPTVSKTKDDGSYGVANQEVNSNLSASTMLINHFTLMTQNNDNAWNKAYDDFSAQWQAKQTLNEFITNNRDKWVLSGNPEESVVSEKQLRSSEANVIINMRYFTNDKRLFLFLLRKEGENWKIIKGSPVR